MALSPTPVAPFNAYSCDHTNFTNFENYIGASTTHTHTHTHTHSRTHTQNVNSLATASGYAHLEEPGCLCTKQAQ